MGRPGRGAKFWLQVLTELKNRGVTDMFIVCIDGLKGFPEAMEAVFPEAQVQLCLVHQVRGSLNYWKQRKAVAADLKPIYQASTVEQAGQRLDEFAANGTHRIRPSAGCGGGTGNLTPFFAYPADIRKVIYTTNVVESLNMSLRKVIKTRGSFPNQEAAFELLYLALEHIAKKWTMPIHNWKAALQRFALLLGDRVPSLTMCVPRALHESFQEVQTISTLPKVERVTVPDSQYEDDGPVGKSCVRISRQGDGSLSHNDG